MNPGAMISSGQTLSGFKVLDTDQVAPASVLWTAFAISVPTMDRVVLIAAAIPASKALDWTRPGSRLRR